MFYDWLSIYQDFDPSLDLPVLSDRYKLVIDTETGESLGKEQPTLKVEGSFSTSITIRISGNRITVKGNPSRFNRLDNLVGFATIDEMVDVYNGILSDLNLPRFTKCTQIFYLSGKDGSRVQKSSDGAVITELHCTTNRAVGLGNVQDYLSGLSTQRYRNSIPRLHTNGSTVDWLSREQNAALIYPSVYEKSVEMEIHLLPKFKRKYGRESLEYEYAERVANFCYTQGVVRFEQKLKSRFLRREDLSFWGISDYSVLIPLHEDFLNIDKRLKVNSMDYQTISEQLLDEEICRNTQSANSTASVFFMWLHGQKIDLSKSQARVHRTRLRKLGIDIAESCDVTKHSPVRVIHCRTIVVSEVRVPDWYQMPKAA